LVEKIDAVLGGVPVVRFGQGLASDRLKGSKDGAFGPASRANQKIGSLGGLAQLGISFRLHRLLAKKTFGRLLPCFIGVMTILLSGGVV
jgi:hypothetical protein